MSEAASQNDPNGVLDSVRRALGRSSSAAPAPLESFIEPAGTTELAELVTRFTAEATAVRVQVYVLSNELQFVADSRKQSTAQPIDKLKFAGRLGEQIGKICAAGAHGEIALSGAELFGAIDLESSLAALGFSMFSTTATEVDHEMLVARLAGCSVGITTADYAIAETGTIVLSSDESHALLVSLLPPVHIAVLRSSRIIDGLDQVISKLNIERVGRADPSRSVSFITGPSRTSDVELTLSIGVHGPKELHVIIVE